MKIENVIDVATAIAGTVGAADIVRLLADPAKAKVAVNRLTKEKLLPDPRTSPPSDLKTAGRLYPEFQLVPFGFRDAEMEDCLAWCSESTTPLAVRLVTGASGRGKTRLQVELCGRLIDDGPVSPGETRPDWIAGFLALDKLKTAPDAGNPFDIPFAAQGNLFIVVDYAENKADDVTKLLRAALKSMDEERRGVVRVVLIARQKTEVFDQIRSDGDLANRASVEMHPDVLEAVSDPEAFFETACNALGVADDARQFPEKLRAEAPDFGLLSLAALLAADTGKSVGGDQTEILDGVLLHEERYWRSTAAAHGVPEVLLTQGVHKQVAAILTLFGLQGAVPDEAEGVNLLARLPLLADQSKAIRLALVKSIAELYPHPEGRIEGVALDLLGDHLVQRELERDPSLLTHIFT